MTEKKPGLSYRDAGVDIDAADAAMHSIKDTVKRTFNERVLQDIGSFGAMYDIAKLPCAEPILVSSVDGVGTKLKVAQMMNKHDTVGVDLVAHCVNDILVQGAKPLFFLDYLGVGRVEPAMIADVVSGVATGCRYAGCALIGGETAEMPDVYLDGDYDLVGMIVGVVDRAAIVDGNRVGPGDRVIGLWSSGLHTNGYSLARKIVFEVAGLACSDPMPGVGRSVGEALLEPHASYAKIIQVLAKIVDIKGMAHITGGGITDNLPRVFPKGLHAEIDLDAWAAPPVFRFLAEAGGVAPPEMLRTFNMGMGFLVIVSESEAPKALESLEMAGLNASCIGRILDGGRGVSYVGELHYAG